MSALPPHFQPYSAQYGEQYAEQYSSRPPAPVMAATSPAPDTAEVLDITGAFGLLWRRKFHILWVAITGVALGMLWLMTLATPIYQATAVLVMAGQEPTMPSIGSLLPGLSGGNDAANTEVETLRARSLLGLVVDDLGLSRDPDFNPDPATAMSYIGQNTLAQWIPLIPEATIIPLAPSQTRTQTIDNLLKIITVRNVPDSMVFEVVVENSDPAMAARIANALSLHYIDRQISVKTAKNTQITQWLDGRVGQLQQQLEEKEAALALFNASMELISPETYAVLSAEVKALRSKIISLEDRKSTPQLVHRINGLQVLEKNLSAQLARQSGDLGQLRQFEREVFAAQQIYTQFLGQFKETTAQIDLAQPDSAILSPAEIPIAAIRPRPMLILLMAAVLGAFLAGGRLLLQEARRQTFRTEAELEEATGQGVLGQLPLFSIGFHQDLVGQLVNPNGAHNNSKARETLRHLRSSLFVGPKTGPRTILITSALPNEGRSVLTMALAQSAAQLGQRVLIIDGDLRRQGLARILGMPKADKNGLLSVLAQRRTLSDAVWRCHTLGLDVLGGSSGATNPADLFHHAAFRRMLQDARASYDVIVIDTPPVLAVPDARVIGAQVDTILFAVHWDQTKSDAVVEGLRSLRQSRLRVHGLVLTRVNTRALRRYGLGEPRKLRGYNPQENRV